MEMETRGTIAIVVSSVAKNAELIAYITQIGELQLMMPGKQLVGLVPQVGLYDLSANDEV
jgi:hypothetical protein